MQAATSTNWLEDVQEEQLAATLSRAYEHVPFYQRRLAGVDCSAPFAVLRDIPFTTKEDLAAQDPYDWLAVDRTHIAEVHTTSGTSGSPLITFLTARDVATWSELAARVLSTAGVRCGDLIFTLSSFGLSVGGFAWLYGARRLGVGLVPAGPGNTLVKLRLMQCLRPTILIAPPSYSLYLARVAEEQHVDLSHSVPLRLSLHGAEPWSEAARRRIQHAFGTEAFDQYGFTELFGPGIGVECTQHTGLHIFTDHFFLEVVDPATGEPLEPGQTGELVFTSLTREAVPLVRYRTRDLSYIIPGPCACGLPFPRIARILGRTDDAVIYRAVKVWPTQIQEALLRIPGIGGNFRVVISNVDGRDVMTIRVECANTGDEMHRRVCEEIRASLGVQPEIELVPPAEFDVSGDRTPKSKHILDRQGIPNPGRPSLSGW